jgi:hypothetical protein
MNQNDFTNKIEIENKTTINNNQNEIIFNKIENDHNKIDEISHNDEGTLLIINSNNN